MKNIKSFTDFLSEGLAPEQGFDDVADYSGFGTNLIEFVDGSTFTFFDAAFENDNIVLIGNLKTQNKTYNNYNLTLDNNNGNVTIIDRSHIIKALPTKETMEDLKYIYKHMYDSLIEKGDDAQYSNVRKKYQD